MKLPLVPIIAGPDWQRRVAQAVNSLLGRVNTLEATVGGYTVVTKTAGYTETATSGELVIKANLAAGFTIVLPTAVGNKARFQIKKMLAAGTIVIDGAGAETIDGAATASLTAQYESVTLVSDNTGWLVV